MKVTFHVDTDSDFVADLTLKNVKNLLRYSNDKDKEVTIVANGSAVRFFQKGTRYENELKELYNKGVKIYLCNASLEALNIKKYDVLEICEIVPSGVVKIVELQEKGYAYIKP
ncbi:MAG: DsrE family protein [Candidatus Brockarchaeota archaeon]|nr:DsrE family protein [Candidatus Brockarchaeota archaeon]